MTETITLTSARGAVVVSTAPEGPYVLVEGAQGFDDGPVQVLERKLGSLPGSVVTGLDMDSRELFVPVGVVADDEASLRERLRHLRRVTSPHGGALTVRVEADYQQGARSAVGQPVTDGSTAWEYDTVDPASGWATHGVRVKCPEPLFSGDPTELTWSLPVDFPDFLEELLPVALSESRVLGSEQIAADAGDVPALGVWSLAGPWSRAHLSDEESGRSMTFVPPRPVAEGEVLTVRVGSREGLPVVAADGSSAWRWLQAPFDLWEPAPGSRVRVQMEGVGPSSRATLAMTPRFESAL